MAFNSLLLCRSAGSLLLGLQQVAHVNSEVWTDRPCVEPEIGSRTSPGAGHTSGFVSYQFCSWWLSQVLDTAQG